MIWIRSIALALLVLLALYAGYFMAHIRIAEEYRVLSSIAGVMTGAAPAGRSVICAYGPLLGTDCEAHAPPVSKLGVPVRYACRVSQESGRYDCADINMVGVATLFTVLAIAMLALSMLARALLPRRRRAVLIALVGYGACIATGIAVLAYQAMLPGTIVWKTRIDERILATRPNIGFTGIVIGDGLTIGLIVIGALGLVIAAAAMKTAR